LSVTKYSTVAAKLRKVQNVGYPAEVGALFTTVSSIRVSRVGSRHDARR